MRDGRLYGLHVDSAPSETSHTMTALAFDDGKVVRRKVVATGVLPDYFFTMSAGKEGLYAATAVTRRFTSAPDEILRIDPVSLQVVGQRTLPMSSVGGLVVRPEGVYVAGPGTVLRLDPVSLRTLARYAKPAKDVVPVGENAFVSLTSSASGLWISYGYLHVASIFRLDPTTLHKLPGSWQAPDEQGTYWVLATPHGAWRNGFTSVAPLLPGGAVGPTARLAGSVQSAVADGEDELVLTDGGVLVRVTSDARVQLVPHPGSQCYHMVSDGVATWLSCESGLVRLPPA